MRSGPPKVTLIVRIETIRKGRVTKHRLICSECGTLESTVRRSKMMCLEEARKHAKTHPMDTVQLA